MATVTVLIPDKLAEQAKQMGLLEPAALSSLLTEEIRRKQVAALFDAADKLARLDVPAMSADEVEAEIHEARRNLRDRRP